MSSIRRHPLGAFYAFTLAFSWGYWIPLALTGGDGSHFPGLLGPMLGNDGDGRFSALLAPALDETDRRQLKGCLEDFVIDHLQINVIQLEVTSAA